MPPGFFLGKGRKRKIRLISWKRDELVSLILLLILLALASVGIAFWLQTHPIAD